MTAMVGGHVSLVGCTSRVACLIVLGVMCMFCVLVHVGDEGSTSVLMRSAEHSVAFSVQDRLASMDAQLFTEPDQPADLVQVEADGDNGRKPNSESTEEVALGDAGFVLHQPS